MSRRYEQKRVQFQFDQIQKELSTLSMTPTNSIETVTKEVDCKSDQMPSRLWEYYDVVTFVDDSLVEMSKTMIESDKLDNESSPSMTHDITLASLVEEYHLWTTPPLPSFGDSFKTSHPHKLKISPFARTFRKSYFFKLEGIQDRNP